MPLPQGAYCPRDAHLRSPAKLAQKLVRFFIAGKRGEVSTRAVTTAPRDVRLDFFRGVALFLIFVDHIPGNVLINFTVQSLGFSDAAEIFIFVSGGCLGGLFLITLCGFFVLSIAGAIS